MDNADGPPPETQPQADASQPQPGLDEPPRLDGTSVGPAPAPPPRASILLRELPYVVVLALTLFGVAYMGFSKRSIVGYWEVLAPLIALVCIADGWRHAHDRSARLRLVWSQALHWLAFVVAMNLVLVSGVQTALTTGITGLAVLTLLALGTFSAGVHILSWQICMLGVVMALGVPAIAWIERSALFLLLIALVVVAVGVALWWNLRGGRQGPKVEAKS